MTLSNSELTFAWTPMTVVFGIVVFLVTAVFSFLIWKRNHYSASSGFLEMLRLLVVAIVAVTLNQPEWRETYEPDEKPVLAILRDASGVETIEFRASAILGPGSLSYDMVKSLTDRLPVMVCPKWLATPTQPIAVEDVVSYLAAALDLPPGDSRIVQIGGPDVVPYRGLIEEYARQKHLRRLMIAVPVLSPWLSGLWLALVTPNKFTIGRHLIEGLKNPTVVRDDSAQEVFPNIHPVGVAEAVRRAIAQEDHDHAQAAV